MALPFKEQDGHVTEDSRINENTEFIELNAKTEKHEEIFNQNNSSYSVWKKYSKIIFLLIIWLIFTITLITTKEKIIKKSHITVNENENKSYILQSTLKKQRFSLIIEGAFLGNQFSNETINYLSIVASILLEDNSTNNSQHLHDIWRIGIVSEDQLDISPLVKKQHFFEMNQSNSLNNSIQLKIWTNIKKSLPIKIGYDTMTIDVYIGVFYSCLLLVILYGLIISEIVHRTFASMLVSTLSIAILAFLDDRPTMNEIIKWIDFETLLLLFSMMTLVGILKETGIFDYLAVCTYKITRGKIWALIHCLSLITTIVSSLLDNVTTILLMTPITIRLCEVTEINPIPVLMAIIIHANIGGTMTPVADPPNIIILSNNYIARNGITFLNFTLHMSVGVLIVVLQVFVHLRFQYRNLNDLKLISKNKSEQSINQLELVASERYKSILGNLQKTYPIKNWNLLIMSGFVLVFVITLFLIESIPEIQNLSPGWCALIGVILLLIISEKNDIDLLMSRIEWSTLLFFASMFIIMESIERLGLIKCIGNLTEDLVMSVSEDYRLGMAIIIILWVSGLTSAFIDSIPVTTMMIKIVVSLAQNESLGLLPLQPLVWALAFGPCFGGNGSLIGASCNVVCADIARQYGYQISFITYLKVGFPIMIGSMIVTTFYLIFAHVFFNWH